MYGDRAEIEVAHFCRVCTEMHPRRASRKFVRCERPPTVLNGSRCLDKRNGKLRDPRIGRPPREISKCARGMSGTRVCANYEQMIAGGTLAEKDEVVGNR